MCLLIIFRIVITKKTSNFTTGSGRDQRQTKEIANSLLIFKLSFIQKNKYLQLGVKTRCLAIERNEINNSFVPFTKELRTFSKARRRRQRERGKTKGLMSRTTAQHVSFKTVYIS